MSSAAAPSVDEGAAPPRKGLFARLKMLILVIILSVVALIAGLVGAMGPGPAIALLTGSTAEPVVTAGGESGDSHNAGAAVSTTPRSPNLIVTPFKEIIVNITATTATGRQTTRFLKVNLALVYDNTSANALNVEARKLYLRDSYQDYLRQLSERDLQGSVGIALLKSELLRRARAITDSEAPRDILIADLIIQ